jgi:serine/threonine-protein kinase
MSVPTEIRCSACGRAATAADRFCGFCGARLDVEDATPTTETTGSHRPHVDRILTALRAATIGEYDVAGEIGRGGMAVVFLAHDLSLNRKVAIKALLPELLYTEGMDRRFKHEARIAAKLDHPNILVIHSVREANDLLYIVMKLVEGLPLSAIAKVAGPLPIPVVRFIVRHVADALSYAHGEGVIHRDVKPANIMVDRRGNVVVMDFGIAKAADDAHLTRTGLVIGTPAYMSPEQCLAQGVAPASDQYSLGVVAYELLTGRTPFRGSALEMQWAHATAGPPAVRTLRADCPPDLDALVMRMMAKAAGDRWPSLHDVSHALIDDPATANAARATLVSLVSEVPGRRDSTLPTTPASPVPIGPGPVAAGDATTDPVRGSSTSRADSERSVVPTAMPNVGPMVAPILTLSEQRIELVAGDSVELVVELDADDQTTGASSVTWETSDPGVATVSHDGFVTAVDPGLAEIACLWRDKRAVCVVHVSAATVAAAKTAPVPPIPAPKQEARPERPAAVVAARAPRRRWWIGVVAAGLAIAAVIRGVRSDSVSTAPADGLGSPAASPPPRSPTAPPTAATVPGGAAVAVVPPPVAPVPSPRSTKGATPTRPNAGQARAGAPIEPAGTPAPPTVPTARADSVRLTANRVDSSGASAARPASAAYAPQSTSAPSPPGATRDSAEDRIPAASREVATALFRDFASAINTRSYTRITTAYSQPTDPAGVTLWQEFLVFVRDYSPRATVRSTSVDASTNPPTISANIDFRWSSDAGFDRVRAGTFVGIGVPVSGGWQLHRVRLAKRFW